MSFSSRSADADSGGAEKYEAPDGALGVFQSRAATAYGVGHRRDRRLLADDDPINLTPQLCTAPRDLIKRLHVNRNRRGFDKLL